MMTYDIYPLPHNNIFKFGKVIVGLVKNKPKPLIFSAFQSSNFELACHRQFEDYDAAFVSTLNQCIIIRIGTKHYRFDIDTCSFWEYDSPDGWSGFASKNNFYTWLDREKEVINYVDFQTENVLKTSPLGSHKFYTDKQTAYFYSDKYISYQDIRKDEIIWDINLDMSISGFKYIEKHEVILLTLTDDELYSHTSCLCADTGKEIWTINIGDRNNQFWSKSESLYLYYGQMYKVNLLTGDFEEKEYSTGGVQPFEIIDDILYYQATHRGLRQNRIGAINLTTDTVLWEYQIMDKEKNEIVEIKTWSPLENGNIVITRIKSKRQTIIFDPNHPDNIPHRIIDNGVHKVKLHREP